MSELKTNLEQILQEKNEKIISQNIKKDVEVLDVVGSYDKEDIKELQDELADAEQELADVRRDLDNSTATISGSGENVALNGTAEARFKKAPLPLGNTEQEVIEAQAGTTVEGESISASGVDLSKVEILSINGNTKQQTTTGKNLLPNNITSQNINGLQVIKNSDGTLLINGTATSQTSLRVATNLTLNSGTYYLSGNIGGSSTTYRLYAPDFPAYDDGTGKQFTLNSQTSSNVILLIFNNVTMSNVLIKPMIEQGSAATSYEPYTGGEASPNPDYPQEIRSAGANMNLFNKDNVTSGVYLDSNGNEASDRIWNISDYIRVIPNETYSYNGITTPGAAPYSAYYDSDKNFISSFKQATGKISISIPNNAVYVRFSLAARNTDPIINDLDTFKFEKGDKATAYSAYNQGNMNVEISNKNLFDGLFELGTIDSSGVKQNSSTAIRTVNFIPINPNTQYILSSEATQIRSVFYDENYQFVGTHPASFTSKENEYYMKFVLSSTDLQTEAQLEQGSTATTYVEHQGQSFTIPTQAPFRKIGDYKDTFVKNPDGKWYEKHIIGEVVFDGSEDENWQQDNNDTYITVNDAKGTGAIPVISNYFTYTGNASGNSWGQIRFGMSNNNLIFFGNLILSDFKAWLSAHNTIVNYVLAVPTYIECTQEQSDILDQINTFYETTNIFSTDEVSPNFTFTYNKVYASPSPDDESPVQTVSGDVEVKVQNKNLFNKDNIKTIDYYIQPIAPNPGEHIYSLNNRNCEIEVEPNTDYIRNIVKVNNMTFWSSITFYDKDHAFISGLWSPDNIITTPSNAKYMILSTSGNVSSLFGDELVLETYYNSLQLEKGTTLTSYVKHKEQVLPLSLKSKNLFDKTRIISTNQGNWEVVQITDGVRIIHKNSYYTGTPKVVFKLKPNTTYTYSQNEAAGYSIQPDGGTKQYANTNQMTVTTRTFRNINYRICCS